MIPSYIFHVIYRDEKVGRYETLKNDFKVSWATLLIQKERHKTIIKLIMCVRRMIKGVIVGFRGYLLDRK